MGRVPYAIIGDGKVAKHFRRYLSYLEIPFRNWPAEDIKSVEPVTVTP